MSSFFLSLTTTNVSLHPLIFTKHFLWISLNIPSKAIIPSCIEIWRPFKYITTKRAHILRLCVWFLLSFSLCFYLNVLLIFSSQIQTHKNRGKNIYLQVAEKEKGSKSPQQSLKVGGRIPVRWYNTALCMQGNKEEKEPSSYLTPLVGGRARAANPGLPSKPRARGKEGRPNQSRHITGSKQSPEK